MEVNFAAECSKLVAELENANPCVKVEWYHEGKDLLNMTLKVRDKILSRYFKDFQKMYIWLDAFKAGLQTSSIILAPNGTTFFD